MLTCSPTRLSLTAADIAKFDRKFTAKQTEQRIQCQKAGIKIGQAPGHLTRNSIVSGTANAVYKRAQSRASKATLCTDGDHQDTTEDGKQADETTRRVLTKPDRLPPFDAAANLDTIPTIPVHQPSPLLAQLETSSQSRLPLRHDSVILEEAESVYNADQPQHFIRRHEEKLESDIDTSNISVERPIPAIVTQSPSNPSLDPGAPVFVPRTRYASNAMALATNNLSRSSSYSGNELSRGPQVDPFLRIRSSFERNTQQTAPRQGQQHAGLQVQTGGTGLAGRQPRRFSRVDDQNADMRRPVTAPEQYSSTSARQAAGSRHISTSYRQTALPYRQSSRQQLDDFQRSRRSHDDTTGRRNHVAHLAVPLLNGPRSSSPAGSSSSVSTPNLLRGPAMPHIHNRSSSLSQGHHSSHNSENARRQAQQITSRASSASTSISALDQAWNNRDSPLDELAQLWSRMSTRPRSVGRSFERLPSAYSRPSLLNGDPFRLDPSSERPSIEFQEAETLSEELKDAAATEMPPSPPPKDSKYMPSIDSALGDPVAVAIALPPSDVPFPPAQSSSPKLPLTPPVRTSSLGSSSPTKGTPTPVAVSSSESCTPKPHQTAATATPRVTVYNDRLPPNTQPDTPADIPHSVSRRHHRGRSDHGTSSTRNPVPLPGSDTPELRHPHRHTYPSAGTPGQPHMHEQGGPLSPQRRNAAESSPQRPQRVGRRVDGENDIEGSLDGLEEDRRTWVRRREDGTLDVTPPREGRFERFLS